MSTESFAPESIPADIQPFLQRPSSKKLEHRKFFKKADVLADLIAAFAHTEGGHIVVGFDPKRKLPVGVRSQRRLQVLLASAEKILRHTALATMVFRQHDGKDIGVIQITAVAALISSPGGMLVRCEDGSVRQMTKDEIVDRATRKKLGMADAIPYLSAVLATQAEELAKAHKLTKWLSSWWAQGLTLLLGAILGVGATELYQYLRSLPGR